MVRKKLKIIWDNEAKYALKSIYRYIKKRESSERAKTVRGEIITSVKSINIFPEKFVGDPYLKNEIGNFRFKVIWSYKIIYEVTSKAILILDIFHTSRNPSHIKPNKKNPYIAY